MIIFHPLAVLTTERLLLRQLTVADADAIFLLRSNENINKFLERKKPDSRQDAVDFINRVNKNVANNESAYWGITLRETGNLIGTIALWNLDPEKIEAEVGFELHPDYQGMGIMREALARVVDFGFNRAGLKTISAYTHRQNIPSQKLLEKGNFVKNLEEEAEIKYVVSKPFI